MSYRTSHSSAGHGDFYDRTMSEGYTAQLWDVEERPVLERWLSESVAQGAGSAIDFACGTGRITGIVAGHVDRVVGVDISEEMLRNARSRHAGVEFVQADLTTERPPSVTSFDLATAFRFFQNAEPELRSAVMGVLADVVRPGGDLVVNVQLNADGPAGLVQRLRRRLGRKDLCVMSKAEMVELLEQHGFRVTDVEWFGFWPRTGSFLGDFGARMLAPARRVVRLLHLPPRRVSQAFMVRAVRLGPVSDA